MKQEESKYVEHIFGNFTISHELNCRKNSGTSTAYPGGFPSQNLISCLHSLSFITPPPNESSLFLFSSDFSSKLSSSISYSANKSDKDFSLNVFTNSRSSSSGTSRIVFSVFAKTNCSCFKLCNSVCCSFLYS